MIFRKTLNLFGNIEQIVTEIVSPRRVRFVAKTLEKTGKTKRFCDSTRLINIDYKFGGFLQSSESHSYEFL